MTDLLVLPDGTCTICNTIHDPFDLEACDLARYPKMVEASNQARSNKLLSNKVYKKRGGPV